MDGSIVASDVGGFSGKEESLIDGDCQIVLGVVAADFHVAVSTARKWVGFPVVKVGCLA